MNRVLGYLKDTQHYTLHYNKYHVVIEGYSDPNWITESNEVKFASGYILTLNGGAVSWKSSKQACIARFTMESKFIEWLRNFLEDISFCPKLVGPINIYCDSQTTIGT